MPLPKLPEGPEWTEDDIQAARRRGKRVALDWHDSRNPGRAPFDADAAFDLIESERLFAGNSQRMRVTMAHEMADGAERFAKELEELADG